MAPAGRQEMAKKQEKSGVYGKDRKHIISMRVDDVTYVKAGEVARKNGSSPGLVARAALEHYLNNVVELEHEHA